MLLRQNTQTSRKLPIGAIARQNRPSRLAEDGRRWRLPSATGDTLCSSHLVSSSSSLPPSLLSCTTGPRRTIFESRPSSGRATRSRLGTWATTVFSRPGGRGEMGERERTSTSTKIKRSEGNNEATGNAGGPTRTRAFTRWTTPYSSYCTMSMQHATLLYNLLPRKFGRDPLSCL